MMFMWTSGQFPRACGIAICALAAVFSATELLVIPAPDRAAGSLLEVAGRAMRWDNLWIAALETSLFLLFGALFWIATRLDNLGRPKPESLIQLSLLTSIALLEGPELLGLVSLVAPLKLPRKPALRFVGVIVVLQATAYYGQMMLSGSHPLAKLMPGLSADLTMAMVTATTVLWHGLTFSIGLFAMGERQRAQQLARANAELAASRQLESETARIAVRLGISRDLHDASGHHLTALNVSLRLMRHLQDPEEVQQKIDECLLVVGQLLHEVRDVVKDLRALQRIDLKTILATMCAGFEGLNVHLELDSDLAEAEPYYAHTLFRCAQEILTNTAKHAEARNVWLKLERTAQGYHVEGRDDGKGVSDFHYGNGLTGMRERVREFGGDFEVVSRSGEGFVVRLQIPVRSAA
jgi:signal transduction histidine kinase